MKYTVIAPNTFKKMAFNAGVLTTTFDPTGATAFSDSNVLGSTQGGITFSAVPTFKDMGESVDNCPKNTKELKKITGWEVKISGKFVCADVTLACKLCGAADVSSTKITPRADLKTSDFSDIWFVGDYSDINEDSGSTTTAGFCAIKMLNALSTAGFNLVTADQDSATFDFEFTAHYSASSISTVPFEIYLSAGTTSST